MPIKLHLEFLYRMTLLSRQLVLLPHLYRLVALAAQQPQTTSVESESKNAVFG
jgi:hypothetical protein